MIKWTQKTLEEQEKKGKISIFNRMLTSLFWVPHRLRVQPIKSHDSSRTFLQCGCQSPLTRVIHLNYGHITLLYRIKEAKLDSVFLVGASTHLHLINIWKHLYHNKNNLSKFAVQIFGRHKVSAGRPLRSSPASLSLKHLYNWATSKSGTG